MSTRTLPLALTLAVLLTACASKPQDNAAVGAVSTPLRDLNLLRQEVPKVLLLAQSAPYVVPADRSCSQLAQELAALNAELEPDLDAPPEPKASTLERGQQEVGKALQKAAEGAVPMRGWLRKLSGAERASRQVERAVEAGLARRAFLRGLSVGQGC